MSRLKTLWHGVCPRCRKGLIFRTLMQMNPRCSDCGLVFEREPGYFLGAMIVSYAFAVAFNVIVYFMIRKTHPQALPWIILEMFIVFLPTVPFVFRYSRMLWIYFDQMMDPEK